MAQVMDGGDMDRAIQRIAHEILEKNRGSEGIILLGIQTRGVPLAKRLALALEEIEGSPVAAGSLDIGLYRDDLDQRPKTELGATTANLQNHAARRRAGMRSNGDAAESGVRVDFIFPQSSADGLLEIGDVILAVCREIFLRSEPAKPGKKYE